MMQIRANVGKLFRSPPLTYLSQILQIFLPTLPPHSFLSSAWQLGNTGSSRSEERFLIYTFTRPDLFFNATPTMQSSTSTSIHEAHTTFNTVHRRQPSYSPDLQDSNTAGQPFAFVPKRRSSNGSGTGRSLSEDSSACTSMPQRQIRLVEETTSEDSSSSQATPRSFCPFPRANSEPSRELIPEFQSDVPPEVDIARTPTLSDPVPTANPPGSSSAFLLRKKSGELVKPSLKSTGFAPWTVSEGRGRTKSAPTTPVGPKSVHFDAHLEHVKLFLAEQKPLAVSRDGSPTETSEGDTTDTCFPFPRTLGGGTLRLKPILLPSYPSEPWTFDVRLEKLSLENTALVGQVLVRNVAFAKWVAVRFTLDAWQTTSEVAARHLASLRDHSFDRFEFRVRLGDYMNGIEFKKLVLCVRFTAEGREMWDSNGGRNYEVGFEKVRDELNRQAQSPSPSGGREGPPLVADLREQLEKVAQTMQGDSPPARGTPLNRRKPRGLRVWLGDRLRGDDDDDDAPTPTPPLRPLSRSPSPLDEQKKTSGTPSLSNTGVPLSARYDFGTSLRSPNWTPPERPTTSRSNATQSPARSPPASTLTHTAQFPRPGHHRRSMTIPLDGGPTSPHDNHMQGSPRDSAHFVDEGVEEHRLSQGDDAFDDNRPRRHSRGWVRGSSFEQIAADTSRLKKTPPGMPTVIPPTPPRGAPKFHLSGEESSSSSSSSPPVSRSASREPLDNVWRALRRNEDENSISTPSISTPSSTPTSLSPLSPLGELPRASSDDSLTTATTPGRSRAQRPPINSSPYYSFLDQFCFFTGVNTHYNHSNSPPHGTPPRRVQSASTVEDYFSLSHHHDDQSTPSTANGTSSDAITRVRLPISANFSPTRELTTSS
ncbi:putative phosphatase regulatory subunit-domain-containing protein [Gautieria morchelliformis]|nr:putative phosphatase regulatory subunit-domain-containing protein [Gautieria morchelliformis]